MDIFIFKKMTNRDLPNAKKFKRISIISKKVFQRYESELEDEIGSFIRSKITEVEEEVNENYIEKQLFWH